MSSEAVVKLGKRLDELTSRIEVRRATAMSPAQLQEAAVMLADSFRDHPMFVYTYPQIERRRKACQALFAGFLREGLRHGIVDVAYDGGIVGVLIAYPPGAYPISLARKVRGAGDFLRIAALSPAGLLKLLRIEKALLQMHPREPHYYGFFLGVAPGHMKAAGLILAKRLIDLAGANGFPIYLEAQDRSSADVYAQFGGCEVLRDGMELYPGGPRTWTLWLEPPPKHTQGR